MSPEVLGYRLAFLEPINQGANFVLPVVQPLEQGQIRLDATTLPA
jgi:hypothetical protein